MPRIASTRAIRVAIVGASAATVATAVLTGTGTAQPQPITGAPADPSVGASDPAYAKTIAVGQAAMKGLIGKLGASMVSVALVDDDSILWSQAMGTVAGPGTTATLTTAASLGSVSKNLAAVGVMQLVDAGKVKLDAPVTRYIPDFTMASPGYRSITVRMILDHTAGIPGTNLSNSVTSTPWPGYAEATLGFLASERLKARPGTLASYCNDCYTLAGILIERVSGKTYPDYVRDAILKPLGMSNTRYAVLPFAEGSIGRLTLANGTTLPVDYDNFYAAGGAYSTPTDMAALAQMYMNDGVYNGRRILSKRAIYEMGTWQVEDTLNAIPDDRNAVKFGLGWDTVEVLGLAAAGVTAWQKGGDTATSHSAFIVAPEAGLSIVVQGVGSKINSTVLQTLGQAVLLEALVEKGVIADLPPTVGTSAPPEVAPTAQQVASMVGYYPQAAFRYQVVPGPGNSLQVSKLLASGWTTQKAQFTLRTDGLWWSNGKVPTAIGVSTARGKKYLLLTAPGDGGIVLEDIYLGELTAPGAALSPTWQARIGAQWVPVNEAAVSWLWFANPVRTFTAIPGMPGYVIASGVTSAVPVATSSSDTVGTMFLRVPGESAGVDIYQTRSVTRDGQEWMWFGTEFGRPVSGIPTLSATASTVTIRSEGYTEWRKVPAGTLALAGDVTWKVFDPTFKPSGSGIGPTTGVALPAGGYVALFGTPGATVTASVS